MFDSSFTRLEALSAHICMFGILLALTIETSWEPEIV